MYWSLPRGHSDNLAYVPRGLSRQYRAFIKSWTSQCIQPTIGAPTGDRRLQGAMGDAGGQFVLRRDDLADFLFIGLLLPQLPRRSGGVALLRPAAGRFAAWVVWSVRPDDK